MKKSVPFILCLSLAILLIGGCSQTIEEKLDSAEKLIENGKLSRGKALIDEIIQADSTSPQAIYGRGLVYQYQAYDWDAIIEQIKASPINDGYFPAMEAFVRLALDLDYTENGRKMSRMYIKRRPDDPAGHLFLTAFDIKENRIEDARANLSRAASLTDDSLTILLYESEIDAHTYDYEKIGAALERLSSADFETAAQFSHLARIYRYLNMADSAVYYARRAVDEDDENVDYRLQLAQYLLDEMRLHSASEVAEDIVDSDSGYGEAHILLAKINWLMNHENQAELDFFKFMQLNSESPISQEKHGDFYRYFKDWEMATIEWQAAYIRGSNLKYPDDYLRQLYIKMLNGFFENKDVSMAMDYFEEGEQLLGERKEIQFFRAEIMASFTASADSARLLVDRQLERHWNDREWLELAAKYFYRRGQLEDAEKTYRRLLEMSYPKQNYYLKLFDIIKTDNQPSEAEALTSELPFRFQRSTDVYRVLYDIYLQAGQIERATEYAELLYKRSREYMPQILELADLYRRQGQIEKARRLITDYRAEYPERPEGYYQVGRFDFVDGQLDSVPVMVEEALSKDTGYAFAMELKGRYFQAEGNMDSAVFYYEAAIERHWPTPMAYHNLAEYLWKRQDNLSRAAGLAMAAVHYFDNDPRGYMLLGQIYYDDGKFKLARQQFYKGSRIFPENAAYQFQLGRAYAQLEEKENARKALRKAIDLGLSESERKEAERILNDL